MAGQSLDVKTDEIYGRRNEKGKEAKNYQDAEKQLLAIQAAQQQNLKAGKINNLAQYQNSQNLINAGNAMSQANASKPQTQQVTVNQPTQQILQKYGATKPGTVTKTTHSQQVTKQNITINNNTTNTTNNQIKTIPNQVSQAIRPQKDNSNEKFKLWLNNTLARQQEEYARREKDYDKRESALTRDSNKMLRKLGEFSKDMMEKMDPRNIGSTATSQIKSLLFIFGFQYLATNWVKILRSVNSIERSFKAGLAYFGLYNMNGQGNFCFRPGESQLAYDLKGLFTGTWGKSPLWQRIGGGSEKVTTSGTKVDKDGGIFGGEHGWAADLRKMLFGDDGGKEGGKDKGLLNIIKDFFVLQGKKRMAAAKMVEKPEFPISDPGAGIKAMGDYFGQLLRIFLGDPDEALREKIVSKISLDARYRSLAATGNGAGGWFSTTTYNEAYKEDEVNTKTGRHFDNVRRGAWAILHGEHKGLTAMTINDDGRLYRGSAESSIGQAQDITFAMDAAEAGEALDTGRLSTGFWRLNERAEDEGYVAVPQTFVDKFLSDEDIKKLQSSGDIKKGTYEWVVRSIDKRVDDTMEDYLHMGNRAFFTNSQDESHHFRRVPVKKGHLAPMDESTGEEDELYELTPNALKYIIQSKLGEEAANFKIELDDRNFLKAIDDWAITLAREKEAVRDPDRTTKYSNVYTNSAGNAKNIQMTGEEADIWKNYGVYIGDDENSELLNQHNRTSKLLKGDQWFRKNVNRLSSKDKVVMSNGNDGNGLIAQAFNDAINSVDITSRYRELVGKEFDRDDLSLGYGTDNNDAFNGLENDYLSGYDFSKFLTGVNKTTGEVINFGVSDFTEKYRTAEDLDKFIQEFQNFNFHTDDISKLITGPNSKYKSLITKQLNKLLSEYATAYNKSGIGNINFNNTLRIQENELDDPKKLQGKITRFFQMYSPKTEYYTDAEGNKVSLDTLKGKGISSLSTIEKIISGYEYLVNNIDDEMTKRKQNAVMKILTEMRRNRTEADQIYQNDLEFVEKLKADPNARFTAAHETNVEQSAKIHGMWSDYDNYVDEYGAQQRQLSQDISNNSAASNIRDAIEKGSDVLFELGELAGEAKDWLGSTFKNAKSVANDFVRQVSYPKVSITKYPSGYKFTKKDKLLIWHAFNGAFGKDVEGKCEVNFKVWDESGRFGAGRNNNPPYTSLSGEKTTFDRLHSGQDISTFFISVDGVEKPYPSTDLPKLYAPFNGKLISIKTDNSGTGRNVLFRQTSPTNPDGGRYGIFVCHLSKITPEAIKHYKEGTTVNKGEELGAMGGSGQGREQKDPVTGVGYPRHFHINVLDFDHPGPLDGPFDEPLPLVSPKWRGFSALGPSTRICNEHAVDPLFVYVNIETGETTNKTLYLTEDRKIVDIESFDKTGKGVNSEGKGLFSGSKSSSDDGDETGEGDKKEGEDDKKKDEGSLIERAWKWLKDLYMKYLSGGIEYMKDKAVEYGGKAKDFAKEFFGKYRNKSMSFRRSSRSYSGQITPEFVNYQNYLKNPGKIPTKPDGTLLTEAEWRNEVFDMTGSDPVSLKLGEFLYNGNKVKTADQVGGEVSETVNNYQNVNNNNENTEVNTNTTEGTPTPSKTPPAPTPAPTVVATKDNIMEASSIFGKGNTLTDAIESYGTDPAEQTANNTKGIKDGVNVLIKAMGLMQGINVKGYEALLASGDVNNKLTAANIANNNSNNAAKQVPEYNQSQGQNGNVK